MTKGPTEMDDGFDAPAQRAAKTYNAAADFFDAPPLAFWDRHGSRAVELSALSPGEHVLDVGCGTGASALPAAEAVGPDGTVTGLDVAENLLAAARAKAAARGLVNVRFQCADMSDGAALGQDFNAAISVFSIFFVPDMERQIGLLWSSLRPGGRLTVTVWGENAFEPAASIFVEELQRLRPDTPPSPRPWERLTRPEGLGRMLVDGGAATPDIVDAPDRQMLTRSEDWWTIALGSGFRGEIDQLSQPEQEDLRVRVLQRLSDGVVRHVETNALHAIARKEQ